jgi:hypothetical protein
MTFAALGLLPNLNRSARQHAKALGDETVSSR